MSPFCFTKPHAALFIIALFLAFFLLGEPFIFHMDGAAAASINASASATITGYDPLSSICLDVEGMVLGNVSAGAVVSLHALSSLDFSHTLNTIKSTPPIQKTQINKTLGFKFSCLPPGKYAFSIPAEFYFKSSGPPVPLDFICTNVALDLTFSGGDPSISLSAFELKLISSDKARGTKKSPLSKKQKDKLYMNCPLKGQRVKTNSAILNKLLREYAAMQNESNNTNETLGG